MRAMAFAYQNDPNIWDELCEKQYCFGSELIVAPVHYGFSRTRPVYLPPGLWRDFWSGELCEGGQVVQSHAELDHIPVFAKAGAIIPRLDPSPQTLTTATNERIKTAGEDLLVDIYPGSNGDFCLYDGTIFQWYEEEGKFVIKNCAKQRQVSVRLVDGGEEHTFAAISEGHLITVLRGSLAGDPRYTRVVMIGDQVELKVSRARFKFTTS
jgi:alpha-glucosidase (family GH31 glycosyl hydrolase)